MKSWDEHLDLLIRARTPLIWIRSGEEERVEELLEQAALRLQPRRLASWDFIEGLKGVVNSEGLGARQPMTVLEKPLWPITKKTPHTCSLLWNLDTSQ